MENKFHSIFGGRVGDVHPPYRYHNISKIILVSIGLDTPLKEHSGLLDQRSIS